MAQAAHSLPSRHHSRFGHIALCAQIGGWAGMGNEEPSRYSNAECAAVFARLFPKGFAGDDVLREIAPDGWEKSPLLATFHPSLDQLYEETVRSHENIESLARRGKKRSAKPPPTREDVARAYHPTPIETGREVRDWWVERVILKV